MNVFINGAIYAIALLTWMALLAVGLEPTVLSCSLSKDDCYLIKLEY